MIDIKMTKSPQFKVDFDLPAREWLDIASNARRMMIDRTKSGIDIDGIGFTGYNKDYAKYKSERGRNTSVVNLEFTSQMHQSLSQKTIPEGVMVYYEDRNRANIAIAHQRGYGRLPERKHFGLTDQQAETITRRVRSAIERLAQRTLR